MFPHLGMTYLARQQHSRQRRLKPTPYQEEMAMAARLAFVITHPWPLLGSSCGPPTNLTPDSSGKTKTWAPLSSKPTLPL